MQVRRPASDFVRQVSKYSGCKQTNICLQSHNGAENTCTNTWDIKAIPFGMEEPVAIVTRHLTIQRWHNS